MSINTVVVSGNLGQDPEIRYFESGNSVTTLSLAVSGYSKGEKTTDWIDCKLWGKPGETVVNYCRKGSKIGVTGKLTQEKWQAADGSSRSKLVVVGFQVELLDPKDSPPAPAAKPVAAYSNQQAAERAADEEPDYDQIPF